MARTPAGVGCDVDYFRVYHDIIDNPKIAELRPETLRFLLWVWCIASRQPARDGTLPHPGEIAFRARCSQAEVEGQLAALVSAGLVEKSGGKFAVARWRDFQPAGQSNAARQSRYRQRKRASKEVQDAQVEPSNVTRDVTVTTRDVTRDVTRNDIRERETTSPSETSSSSAAQTQTPSPPSTSPQPPRGGQTTTMPPGTPTDVWQAVDLVRRELGDRAANAVEVLAEVVDRDVGGRWDCFAAAVRAARRSAETKPIRDVRVYLIRLTKQFVHDGIPPEPVEVKPPPRADPAANVIVIDEATREFRRRAREGRKHGG